MKRILASILISFGLVAAVPLTASANPNPSTPRFVSGVVTDEGKPVKHASVSATCNGKTKSDKTNAGGFYHIKFNSKDCPNGSTATVTATKGDKGGAGQTTIHGPVNTVNISISTPVVPVPEMGPIVAVGATIAAGGAFFLVRRRKLAQFA